MHAAVSYAVQCIPTAPLGEEHIRPRRDLRQIFARRTCVNREHGEGEEEGEGEGGAVDTGCEAGNPRAGSRVKEATRHHLHDPISMKLLSQRDL